MRGVLRARGAAGRTGRRGGRFPGGSPPRSVRRRTSASGSPSSAASSSHSASVTGARNCGWSSRPFSARNRANSSRCHCSYAHSATSRSRSLPNWRHFARSPLRSAACVASRCSGRRSANTPRLSMAARDAASAARRAARTDGLQLLSKEGGQGAHGWPQMITVVPASRCDWTSARSWSKYGVGSSPGLKVADGGLTSTLSARASWRPADVPGRGGCRRA